MFLGPLGTNFHDLWCLGSRLEIYRFFVATLGHSQILRHARGVVIWALAGSLTNSCRYSFRAMSIEYWDDQWVSQYREKRSRGHLTSDTGNSSQPGCPSTEGSADFYLNLDAKIICNTSCYDVHRISYHMLRTSKFEYHRLRSTTSYSIPHATN